MPGIPAEIERNSLRSGPEFPIAIPDRSARGFCRHCPLGVATLFPAAVPDGIRCYAQALGYLAVRHPLLFGHTACSGRNSGSELARNPAEQQLTLCGGATVTAAQPRADFRAAGAGVGVWATSGSAGRPERIQRLPADHEAAPRWSAGRSQSGAAGSLGFDGAGSGGQSLVVHGAVGHDGLAELGARTRPGSRRGQIGLCHMAKVCEAGQGPRTR